MSERLTDDQLTELERLLLEATRGPWKDTRTGTQEIEIGAETPRGHLSVAWIHLGAEPSAQDVADGKADAALIRAARNALPSLLAEVKAAGELRALAERVIAHKDDPLPPDWAERMAAHEVAEGCRIDRALASPAPRDEGTGPFCRHHNVVLPATYRYCPQCGERAVPAPSPSAPGPAAGTTDPGEEPTQRGNDS